MQKQKVTHPHRDPGFVTGAYSDGVIVNGFLFISGQACIDFKTSTFIFGTIEEETALTLENIQAIAAAAGAAMDDIVKCTVHLSDIKDFAAFNGVYEKYFTGVRPARTTVQSVLFDKIKVEIDAIIKMPE